MNEKDRQKLDAMAVVLESYLIAIIRCALSDDANSKQELRIARAVTVRAIMDADK